MKKIIITIFLISMIAGITKYTYAQGTSFEDGKKAFNSQKYYQAIEIFSNLLKNNPKNKTMRYYLAQAYYKSKDYNKASNEFKLVYQLAPESLEGKYSKVALDQIQDLTQPTTWKKSINIKNNNAAQDNYLKEIALNGKYISWNLNSMPLKIYIDKNPKNLTNFDPILFVFI
ncbi:MAG: tol-pal system YbgF family protein, partial [Vampirovibrionia bacterium]